MKFQSNTVKLSFFPFLIFWVCFALPVAVSSSIAGFEADFFQWYQHNFQIFYLIETLYLFTFTLFALRVLLQGQAVIKDFFSNWTQNDINWSKYLLYGIIFYFIFDVPFSLSESTSNYLPYINLIITLLVVIYLGYYGFFQSQILVPSFLLKQQEVNGPTISNSKIAKPAAQFSISETEHIHEAIINALEKDKMYLKESLTLSNLADRVDLKDKKLSAFINQEMKTNFYELINQYRVEAFKKDLMNLDNQHLTIWGTANQCGFKSKTSFNRIFKKRTGMTPSQYQKFKKR